MRVTYDEDADAAYVYFADAVGAGDVKRTVPSGLDLDRAFIAFDFGPDGRILGLEILGASRVLAQSTLKSAVEDGQGIAMKNPTDAGEDLATNWALAALNVLGTRGFAQIDIDQLLPVPTTEFARDASIDAFLAVREVLHSKGSDFTAAVVFPLPPAAELLITPTSLEDWPSSVDLSFNVPGLYIAPADAFIDLAAAEDYRASLALVDQRLSNATSYYRAFRPADEAQRDWEYSRAIYVLAAPDTASKEARVPVPTVE